jgi:D-arabinan exo alpha-(1,3)/(1,5)-arabinofuranosidase (non-reducing end)
VTGPLSQLPRLTNTSTRRESSWDRTGGNRDRAHVEAGSEVVLLDTAAPATIRHIWMTTSSEDPDHLRSLVLRAHWDGEHSPSIEVPLGDFFGVGHALTRNYWSLPLQMSPQDGRGFNCWLPMPFAAARVSVENQSGAEARLYYYIDYELDPDIDASLGRLHAQWRRESPCDGIAEDGLTNFEFQESGVNLTGDGNYVILEASGHGHYIGCVLSITNLRDVPAEVFNWYGEGDDMIFVDGESFPPSFHGTGTEDYFGLAWCPTESYSGPYHGIVLPGGENWSGRISLYRFHVEDPIRFQKSIRVTIEHGHANRRSDDYSSVAYWYQAEPHLDFPVLPAASLRAPSR